MSSHLQIAKEEERARIARDIHDELGGLLVALKFEVSLLANKTAPDTDAIKGRAQSMSRLVDDLLSLSRLELKSHIAPDQSVDLRPVIGHVRDALLPLAEELGVSPAAVVVAYITSQKNPSIAIAGSSKVEQITDTLNGADLTLTEEQLAFLVGKPTQ